MWFEGGRKSSSHFTYTARAETGAKVLILCAENYTAGVPAYPDTDRPDLPDVLHRRARRQRRRLRHLRRRQARQPLARLARRARATTTPCIWYTGDDYLTRQPGQGPGTGTARLAVEEMIDVRDFLNEGGKLFYTGKYAGQQYAEGNEFRNFGFPEPPEGGRL